jgi:hypothetical protein
LDEHASSSGGAVALLEIFCFSADFPADLGS